MDSKKRFIAAGVAVITAFANAVSLAGAADSENEVPEEIIEISAADTGGTLSRKISGAPSREQGNDRYFRVTGLKYTDDNGEQKQAEILLNTADSDSRCGNITIFTREYLTAGQLKNAVLDFEFADGIKISSGGAVQVSGETENDLSGTAVYTVTPDDDSGIFADGERNYTVKVLPAVVGDVPNLSVDNAGRRDVYFNSYFGNTYTVCAYNTGKEELSGVNVELVDAKNVRLAEGEDLQNAVIEPFSEKGLGLNIVLEPIGGKRGVISGTLRITADGQEPVEISLGGFAGDPDISANSLESAVKYVPYSDYLEVDSGFDWLKTEVTVNDLDGFTYDPATGEIYGCPQEEGNEEFTASVRFYIDDDPGETVFASDKALEISIEDNTDKEVFLSTDEGYEIKKPIGEKVGEYSFEKTYEVPEGVSAEGKDFADPDSTGGEDNPSDYNYTIRNLTYYGVPDTEYRFMDINGEVLAKWTPKDQSDYKWVGDLVDYDSFYFLCVASYPEEVKESGKTFLTYGPSDLVKEIYPNGEDVVPDNVRQMYNDLLKTNDDVRLYQTAKDDEGTFTTMNLNYFQGPFEGIRLRLTDSEGNVLKEWDSNPTDRAGGYDTEPLKYRNKLKVGETYTIEVIKDDYDGYLEHIRNALGKKVSFTAKKVYENYFLDIDYSTGDLTVSPYTDWANELKSRTADTGAALDTDEETAQDRPDAIILSGGEESGGTARGGNNDSDDLADTDEKKLTFGEWLDLYTEVTDEELISKGDFSEFAERVWLNGRLLDESEYEAVEGSTEITIRSQTLIDNVVDGRNTVAIEFRADDTRPNELKVTAQNFRIELESSEEGGSSKSRRDRDGDGDGEEEISFDAGDRASAPSDMNNVVTEYAYTNAAPDGQQTGEKKEENPNSGSGINYVLAALTLISSAAAFAYGRRDKKALPKQ